MGLVNLRQTTLLSTKSRAHNLLCPRTKNPNDPYQVLQFWGAGELSPTVCQSAPLLRFTFTDPCAFCVRSLPARCHLPVVVCYPPAFLPRRDRSDALCLMAWSALLRPFNFSGLAPQFPVSLPSMSSMRHAPVRRGNSRSREIVSPVRPVFLALFLLKERCKSSGLQFSSRA